MIEVTATLPRGSAYLAGEQIKCHVTFKNSRPNNGDRNRLENCDQIAWASVQIHCQCSVSESRVKLVRSNSLSTEEVSTTGCNTSFVPNRGERGLTVFSTKPKILFCDLQLLPGESKTYLYCDSLPQDAPPSFRGQAVKYSYKLTIGTQRLNHPTRLLRIPIRVLVLYGLNDISVYNEPEEVAPTNPFLKAQRQENSLLDVALQVIATVTARKSPNTYNITNARGKVGKFCLFKLAYKLGEDIVGVFDFTGSTIPCVQFSVTLQSEEQIAEECRIKSKDSILVMPYSKQQEMCLHLSKTHICVPIPMVVTPGFITDTVCLRWRLHFEFVTALNPVPGPPLPTSPEESTSWMGAPVLDVETMVWDLPIKIFPSNPIHASGALVLRTTNSISV
ncbi:RAB6A-GEF complex partner protein 2-like [Liolophura sinensis]|uniref:RAB6A-GEF complex partner protein 2-like n=1 Tax=Liolophura sinensis TaxID=3198878 RepID=UPI0031583A4E